MSAACFYFEVHQPYRVRPYNAFQVGVHHDYFDERLNREVMRKVASRCYLPANELIARLIERTDGRFRVAYSITGVALEQMEAHAPEVIESFQQLVGTGAVELLAETYHHSLAALHDPLEFREQVAMHERRLLSLFGVKPRVFCNTELIYDDRIGRELSELGYLGVLAEGADDILEPGRSPNLVYRAPGCLLALLLKNYRLSDDIAFRFSDPRWSHHPLSASTFAEWVRSAAEGGDSVNLFMDYETFGEHQRAESGIFAFFEALPDALLSDPNFRFKTPSEVIGDCTPAEELSFPRTVSWADAERDVSAWQGNEMQRRALSRAYELGVRIKRMEQPELLAQWRRLTTSDHYYYMCTKWFSDGDVHTYFSPYESPYEAFINFSNALADLETCVEHLEQRAALEAVTPATAQADSPILA